MRKVFLFASATIAALAMVSCNKEIEIRDQIAEGICPYGYYVEELVAEYPHDPETRTAFNETTGKFAWTEGDELAFHLSNGTYTSAAIDPATSRVKLYLPVGVTRDNYAVYPASAVVDEAAEIGNMQVTLPSTYDISGNLTTEFVPMPLIATNDAENKNLKFEHVGGLLQVNLNVPAGVKTATLSMGKTITGTFDLTAGSGNGVIEAGTASDDALTFILSEEGLATEKAVKLLAPLPSGSYEKFEITYDNGYAFTKDLSSSPWNFDRTQGKKVSIAVDSFEDNYEYFWFEALEAGSTVHPSSIAGDPQSDFYYHLFYSYDRVNWEELVFSETANQYTHLFYSEEDIILPKVGDRVYLKGYTNNHSNYVSNIKFSGSGKLAVGGNIVSLYNCNDRSRSMAKSEFRELFYDNDALVDASNLIMPDYTVQFCFTKMFEGCSNLETPPVLPASVVENSSYSNMFYDCVKLRECPEIPATTIKAGGCNSMFYLCKSLVKSCDLPATTIEGSAYSHMFDKCYNLEEGPKSIPVSVVPSNACEWMFVNCWKLKTTPSLPAMKVEDSGYRSMFESCKSLTSTPELPATSIGQKCYYNMFVLCSNLKYAMAELPATDLAQYCYYSMFSGTALEKAPHLPATVLVRECYEYMFKDCSNLKEVSVAFLEWDKSKYTARAPYPSTYFATNDWLKNVSATGVFKKPAALEILRSNTSCIPNYVADESLSVDDEGYYGWKVVNIDY